MPRWYKALSKDIQTQIGTGKIIPEEGDMDKIGRGLAPSWEIEPKMHEEIGLKDRFLVSAFARDGNNTDDIVHYLESKFEGKGYQFQVQDNNVLIRNPKKDKRWRYFDPPQSVQALTDIGYDAVDFMPDALKGLLEGGAAALLGSLGAVSPVPGAALALGSAGAATTTAAIEAFTNWAGRELGFRKDDFTTGDIIARAMLSGAVTPLTGLGITDDAITKALKEGRGPLKMLIGGKLEEQVHKKSLEGLTPRFAREEVGAIIRKKQRGYIESIYRWTKDKFQKGFGLSSETSDEALDLVVRNFDEVKNLFARDPSQELASTGIFKKAGQLAKEIMEGSKRGKNEDGIAAMKRTYGQTIDHIERAFAKTNVDVGPVIDMIDDRIMQVERNFSGDDGKELVKYLKDIKRKVFQPTLQVDNKFKNVLEKARVRRQKQIKTEEGIINFVEKPTHLKDKSFISKADKLFVHARYDLSRKVPIEDLRRLENELHQARIFTSDDGMRIMTRAARDADALGRMAYMKLQELRKQTMENVLKKSVGGEHTPATQKIMDTYLGALDNYARVKDLEQFFSKDLNIKTINKVGEENFNVAALQALRKYGHKDINPYFESLGIIDAWREKHGYLSPGEPGFADRVNLLSAAAEVGNPIKTIQPTAFTKVKGAAPLVARDTMNVAARAFGVQALIGRILSIVFPSTPGSAARKLRFLENIEQAVGNATNLPSKLLKGQKIRGKIPMDRPFGGTFEFNIPRILPSKIPDGVIQRGLIIRPAIEDALRESETFESTRESLNQPNREDELRQRFLGRE